ncbi:hypothetical protein GGD70_001938 [Paraburkholderia fungorum]|jgi:hypothetical protein|nr:hypothetical protein [Paraburkholderia fungorum]
MTGRYIISLSNSIAMGTAHSYRPSPGRGNEGMATPPEYQHTLHVSFVKHGSHRAQSRRARSSGAFAPKEIYRSPARGSNTENAVSVPSDRASISP